MCVSVLFSRIIERRQKKRQAVEPKKIFEKKKETRKK